MRKDIRGFAAALFAVFLVGCGGGGTKSFTVTATATQGGSISPGSQTVSAGGTAAFSVTASTGHHLVGVSGCGGTLTGTTYTTGVINAACTVAATFAINVYDVTTDVGSGGSVSPASAEVNHGSTTTFTVTPDDGYLVDSASGCQGTLDGDQYTTGSILAPCTVSVRFRLPTVSGKLTPAEGTAADSDVNDPNAPFSSNNNIAGSQRLLNPVTVGGYVNDPDAGEEGRSLTNGDTFDIYRANLRSGQWLVLEIESDDVEDDLDLFLVDSEGNLVDFSVDPTSRFEILQVPPGTEDDFFVIVDLFEGASNYTLTLGEPFSSSFSTLRLSDSFVPGEVVMKLRAGEKAGGELAKRAQGGGATHERNALVQIEALGEFAPATEKRGSSLGFRYRDDEQAEKVKTLYAVKMLRKDSSVESASPNYLSELHALPNDPRYPSQWHYPQINLPQAWDHSTGAGVVVAVIDSGVLTGHPDLQGQLLPGYDFIRNIASGDDPGQSPRPIGGSSFHGTHVAGTIAAAANNAVDGAGVAYDAKIIPLRVCDIMCPLYAIEQAMRYAAGLPNDSGTTPAQPADVINLSLGRGGSALDGEQALINQIIDLDITIVAAAGNDATSAPAYPAAYNGVIAVGAVDLQRQRAPYSNFGSWVDVVAPGGDGSRDLNGDGRPDGVLSTYGDDRSTLRFTTGYLQGTSMAAPHVAGIVALMKSVAPALTPSEIGILINNGAVTDDLGPTGNDDTFGHGQMNALKAVVAAIDSTGTPVTAAPLLVASQTQLNFGATREELKLVLSNGGGGSLTVNAPTDDSGGWLEIDGEVVGGRLEVALTVDRAGLSEGLHEATVTFPSSANTVTVDVIMQVASLADRGIGLQYVLLYDVDAGEVVGQGIAELQSDGTHDFVIEDVEPGTYLLISGSDTDNDFFICGLGESCGVFRSTGDFVVVDIDGADVIERDFSVSYRPTVGTLSRESRGWRRLPTAAEKY